MMTSKSCSSMMRAPSLPEVATRQWKPIRPRLSATVSAWARSLSTISTSAGGAGAPSAPPSAVEWATGDAGVILLMITHAGTFHQSLGPP